MSENRSFPCEFCGIQPARAARYNQHILKGTYDTRASLLTHINKKHRAEACAKYPGRCCEVCGRYFSTHDSLEIHRDRRHNLGRNPLHNLAAAAAAAANNEDTDSGSDSDEENRSRSHSRSRSRSRSRSPRRNRTKNNNQGGYRRKTRRIKRYRTRRH
jgi:hypothetical protein